MERPAAAPAPPAAAAPPPAAAASAPDPFAAANHDNYEVTLFPTERAALLYVARKIRRYSSGYDNFSKMSTAALRAYVQEAEGNDKPWFVTQVGPPYVGEGEKDGDGDGDDDGICGDAALGDGDEDK